MTETKCVPLSTTTDNLVRGSVVVCGPDPTERLVVLDIYDEDIFHAIGADKVVMQFGASDIVEIVGHVDVWPELESITSKLARLLELIRVAMFLFILRLLKMIFDIEVETRMMGKQATDEKLLCVKISLPFILEMDRRIPTELQRENKRHDYHKETNLDTIIKREEMERKPIHQELCSHIIGDLADVVLSYFDHEIKIQDQWGRKGSGEGEFQYPTGVCRLVSGEILVADSGNNRLQVLSPDGKFLRQWGKEGSGEGEFNSPQQILVIPSLYKETKEEVVVVDTENHRIQVFTSEGKFLRQWGNKGVEEGELYYPRGIAALPGRKVIIFNSDSTPQIQIFTTEGKFLRRWEPHGPKESRLSHISAITGFSDGKIMVADNCGQRIQTFTEEGKFLELMEKVPAFYGSQVQVLHLDKIHFWQWGDHDTPGWWLYFPTEMVHLSEHRVAIPKMSRNQIEIYQVHLV